MQITKDIIVFYHDNCADGFGAAWTAHKKFGENAAYIPIRYGTLFSRDITNKEIYLLDFTNTPEEMQWLLGVNRSVVVIDHHQSQEEVSKISTQRIFDVNHSGAVLAWQFFFPNEPLPTLLSYVEDYDLWRHQLSYADVVRKYVTGVGFTDFEVWDKLAKDLDTKEGIAQIIDKGEFVSQYEKNILDQLEKQAYLVEFEGLEIYVANAPSWFSDFLAERLYKKKPPMAIIWRENKRAITASLRSDGSVDVSKIAAKYAKEGGGHPTSAGMAFSIGLPLPWKRIEK